MKDPARKISRLDGVSPEDPPEPKYFHGILDCAREGFYERSGSLTPKQEFCIEANNAGHYYRAVQVAERLKAMRHIHIH